MKYEKGTFTVIPNQKSLKGLNPQAQCLYMWLCHHANKDNSCFPSRKLLADECGISKGSVDNMLKILIGSGLIKKENRNLEGRDSKTTNMYYVNLAQEICKGSITDELGVAHEVSKGSPPDVQGGSPPDVHITKPTSSNQIQLTKEVASNDALTPKQENILFFSEKENKDGLKVKHEISEWVVSRGFTNDQSKKILGKFYAWGGERTPDGKKQKWQTYKTFEIRRRLSNKWFEEIKKDITSSDKRTEQQKRDDEDADKVLKSMGLKK